VFAGFFSFSDTFSDDLVDTSGELVDFGSIQSTKGNAAFWKNLDVALGR
jgi:hypothetical protein